MQGMSLGGGGAPPLGKRCNAAPRPHHPARARSRLRFAQAKRLVNILHAGPPDFNGSMLRSNVLSEMILCIVQFFFHTY